MKWDWLWGAGAGGGMWAPAESQPTREAPAPVSAPTKKTASANLLINIAGAVVWGLWFMDKIPLSTVVIAWPLIEILRRIDVIAKQQFSIDVDDPE